MAMQRVMLFPATSVGRADFRLAYEAFRGRDPEKLNKEDRRHAAELQEAMEAISDPVGNLPDDADLDVRFRRLREEGGEIVISQRTHELLVSMIEEAKFQAGVSLQAVGLRDRLGAAEQRENGLADEPRRPRLAGRK